MARGLDNKIVKSADRVLAILEYVGRGQQGLTVMDISRDLGYPQSSTSELLSCLVHRGYLRHDRARRTFHPTVRVAVLGNKVQSRLTQRGALFDMIDDIHGTSGYPVVLSTLQRSSLHLVYHAGDPRPLSSLDAPSPLHSALGQVLLSHWNVEQVRALIHRLNAEAAAGTIVPPTAFIKYLEAVRRRGYAVSSALPGFTGRTVSLAVPSNEAEATLSLGLAIGDNETDEEVRELVSHLRGAVSRYLNKELAGVEPTPTLALRA